MMDKKSIYEKFFFFYLCICQKVAVTRTVCKSIICNKVHPKKRSRNLLGFFQLASKRTRPPSLTPQRGVRRRSALSSCVPCPAPWGTSYWRPWPHYRGTTKTSPNTVRRVNGMFLTLRLTRGLIECSSELRLWLML